MTNPSTKPELPPGQQLVAPGKWPVIGEREPAKSDEPWTLTISGLVTEPKQFSLSELGMLKQTTLTIDIHCVTRWSKLGVTITGVLLGDLLQEVTVDQRAKFLSFVSRSARNHSTSLAIPNALKCDTVIATHVDGQPLDELHGGPIRNIVPGKYFYKSVKWLENIELLENDRLGFWESETGYHNDADPWLEQRYMAPNLDRREIIKLIESNDFSDRDLRSIDASKRNLNNLKAVNSQLRDANFENCVLRNADFRGANLSNAHFNFADLSSTNFQSSDLEGADLSGADLRGANLTDCLLTAASFCEFSADGTVQNPAVFDHATRISPESLKALAPAQAEFVRNSMSL